MAKKSKLARSSDADEDRLSSLPDDILTNNILPLLPRRDARRTSILARRWRSLWLYVPCLDLDCSEKVVRFPRDNPKDGYSQELDEKAASKYAEWVDGIIDAYKGLTTLRHFRVLFRLDSSLAHKIDSWIQFSLRQGVDVLELDCCWRDNVRNPPYRFLSIEPSLFPNIRLLKSLTLKAVQISSDSLEHLLSACEFLERLQLANVSSLTQVNVTGPVSRLKHIHIDFCGFGSRLRSIRILSPTPDLVSFTYPYRDVVTLHIEHAPRLVDLQMVLPLPFSGSQHTIVQPIIVHPLFRYLSQLEALHLVLSSPQTCRDMLRDFPVLSRLKRLKLKFDQSIGSTTNLRWKLRCLASLIEIAPFLQHLKMEVSDLEQPVLLKKELAIVPLQLPVPVIELVGFRGWSVHCGIVLHLIKAAPSLEKLILDRRDPFHQGCMLGPYKYPEKVIKSWEKVVKEKIEPQLPSKVKLVLI